MQRQKYIFALENKLLLSMQWNSIRLSFSLGMPFISLIEQTKATVYHSSHRKSGEGSTIGSLEFITLDQVRTTKVFM